MLSYRVSSLYVDPGLLFGFAGADVDTSTSPLQFREDGEAFYLQYSLPEYRRKDLTIEVQGHQIEISAKREQGILSKQQRALRRVVTLPEGADPTQVEARFSRGKLSLRVAKLAHARRRAVPIRVNGVVGPAPTQKAPTKRRSCLRNLIGPRN